MSPLPTLSRVELWAATVASDTKMLKPDELAPIQLPIPGGPLTSISSNVSLRTRAAGVSRSNPQRACKRAKVMEELRVAAEHGSEDMPRRRGRPPKGMRGAGRGRNRGQSHVAPSEVFDPAEASQPIRPASPKKRGRTISQSKTDATIDMKFLESCRPSVKLKSPREARESGPLPQSVTDLYQCLSRTPGGFIPGPLKPSYEREADTPQKSRDPPLERHYLPREELSVPVEHIQCLKRTVDHVVKMAARNHRTKAHERQWGSSTVGPLVNEVLRWPQNRNAVSLNVETCPIEPVEMRMMRPNGRPLDNGTSSTGAQTIITEDVDVTTSRMVDMALGLELDYEASSIVSRAFETMRDNEHSLNQSLAYIRDTPLFLDFELKKTISNRDPEVQLGIWTAALQLKRLHHGWNTSMPMPGIVVNGHDWVYYLTFEKDDGLIMMGPQRFGSTIDTNSTFEIVYRLNILVQWGTNQYKKWFDGAILDWCRNRIGGGADSEDTCTSLTN